MEKVILYCADGSEYAGEPAARMWPAFFLAAALITVFLGWQYNKAKATVAAPALSQSTVAANFFDTPAAAFRSRKTPKDAPFRSVHTERGDWSIKYTSVKELATVNAYAETDPDTQTIWLAADAPKCQRQGDLVHEMLHVALRISGGEDNRYASNAGNEEFVNPAGRGFTDILHRNPQIVAWLTK